MSYLYSYCINRSQIHSMTEKKKMGRPTDNPKDVRITVRLDAESADILKKYCEQNKLNNMQAVREAIKKLKNELK